MDKRSDIWAFGCVLYEMLTGQRAFGGEDVTDTLAFVLTKEPDWDALPPTTPPSVAILLRRCLEKDRRRRISHISTALFAIDEAGALGPPARASSAAIAVRPIPLWRRLATYSAPALIAGLAVAGGAVWVATRPVPPRVLRFAITTTPATALAINGLDRDLAITPDGSRVVYVGNNGRELFVRPLDALEPMSLFTGAPRAPFVSPDGLWVGFIDGANVLKKVALSGGPTVTIATLDGNSRGATWTPDDTIVFATNATATGLQQVAAAGGPTTVLTRPDRARGDADHLWPERLPGGRALLFTVLPVTGGVDAAQVAVLDRQTGVQTVVVRGGSHAHYVGSGHLVYAAANTLRAVAFDPVTLRDAWDSGPGRSRGRDDGRGARRRRGCRGRRRRHAGVRAWGRRWCRTADARVGRSAGTGDADRGAAARVRLPPGQSRGRPSRGAGRRPGGRPLGLGRDAPDVDAPDVQPEWGRLSQCGPRTVGG